MVVGIKNGQIFYAKHFRFRTENALKIVAYFEDTKTVQFSTWFDFLTISD